MSKKAITPEAYTAHGVKAVTRFASTVMVNIDGAQKEMQLSLTYAPDKLLISSEDYQHFLKAQCQKQWPQPETFVTALVADLYDVLVPFKIKAKGALEENNFSQKISIKKMQPSYQKLTPSPL